MDDSQHIDVSVIFKLIKNSVRIDSYFPYRIFVQLGHFTPYTRHLFQIHGFPDQLFTEERRAYSGESWAM